MRSKDPIRNLIKLKQTVEQLFGDQLFRPDPRFLRTPEVRVRLFETETEIMAKIDIKELRRDDNIEVEVNDDTLIIGTKINRRFGRSPVLIQQPIQQFKRSISLPVSVKSELAETVYENGMIMVHMPKY